MQAPGGSLEGSYASDHTACLAEEVVGGSNSAAEPGADVGALVLHEGIGTIGRAGCDRWPAELRLRSTLGQLVMGRCKSTNLCVYCAKLAAVENAELLALDAVQGVAPMVWLVLSTGTDELDPAVFYDGRRALARALRRAFPDRTIEWAALVEFTTGYSSQSGGRRFPHWNVLLKGLSEADLARVQAVVERVWCGRREFKAVAEAQHVGLVHAAGGLMRYLALHFHKQEQTPPEGWRGHRFLKSRGYLWTSTPAAREQARASLRLKRELWRLEQSDALTAEEALQQAERAVYEAGELAWELVRLVDLPTAYGLDELPCAWSTTTQLVRA